MTSPQRRRIWNQSLIQRLALTALFGLQSSQPRDTGAPNQGCFPQMAAVTPSQNHMFSLGEESTQEVWPILRSLLLGWEIPQSVCYSGEPL